jgi:hypothetical protein
MLAACKPEGDNIQFDDLVAILDCVHKWWIIKSQYLVEY